jgi:hypothetical protein
MNDPVIQENRSGDRSPNSTGKADSDKSQDSNRSGKSIDNNGIFDLSKLRSNPINTVNQNGGGYMANQLRQSSLTRLNLAELIDEIDEDG